MIESLLLITSICLDAFFASIAYGTNKIKIPFISSFIISLIGALILGISLFFGGFIKEFLPNNLAVILSFFILFIIGIYRLFEGIFKAFIQKKRSLDKPLTFKLFDMNFVLQVYADETIADYDKSKTLSPKEAFYLSIALSFDSLAVGFGSSLGEINFIQTIILCFIFGLICISLGHIIGKKLLEKINVNLSWISGIILIILAILKLK